MNPRQFAMQPVLCDALPLRHQGRFGLNSIILSFLDKLNKTSCTFYCLTVV